MRRSPVLCGSKTWRFKLAGFAAVRGATSNVGYVPTAMVALTLVDALRLCDRLNAQLGLDREAWTKLVGCSMAAGPHDASLH